MVSACRVRRRESNFIEAIIDTETVTCISSLRCNSERIYENAASRIFGVELYSGIQINSKQKFNKSSEL